MPLPESTSTARASIIGLWRTHSSLLRRSRPANDFHQTIDLVYYSSVDCPQKMIGRDASLQAEPVEQRPQRDLPLARHRAVLHQRRLNQDFTTAATPTFSTESARIRNEVVPDTGPSKRRLRGNSGIGRSSCPMRTRTKPLAGRVSTSSTFAASFPPTQSAPCAAGASPEEVRPRRAGGSSPQGRHRPAIPCR